MSKPDFDIHTLANLVYSPEGIERANVYAKSRGVDPIHFRHPWTVSGSDASIFKDLTGKYPHYLFPDTLFIPITDIADSSVLVAFEMRYLGSNENRTRYMKVKTSDCFPLYFTHDLQMIQENTPVIVTEGVFDAESVRSLGYPVISPLTAMHGVKWLMFLRAISKNIYIAYDNDAAGSKANEDLMKDLEVDQELSNSFRVLQYPEKDFNAALSKFGRSIFYQGLRNQIKEI